ncbi:MAG: hypothetical protein ABIH92_04095 [Nanoarchaeota archaeon]
MEYQERLVEAIEEGKIVKVSEHYAKREGLVILKKPEIRINNPSTTPSYFSRDSKRERVKPLSHYLETKPDWRQQQVLQELVDNFHWQIRMNRRRLGLTRKQLAKMINEPDEDLRILETGHLPSKDFVLINKIQKALGINLRKDQKEFDLTTEEIMERARKKDQERQNEKPKNREDYSDLVDSGIEILEDEI